MKKIIIWIIIAIVLIGGGIAAGYFFFSKSQAQPTNNPTSTTTTTNSKDWNSYSVDKKPQFNLGDFLLSTSNGYLVKTTVTIEFKDDLAYKKFEGYSDEKTAPATPSDGSKLVPPMEEVLKSLVNSSIEKEDDTRLKNSDLVQQDLVKYLNNNLGLDPDFIKNVYLYNYVIQ